MRGSDDAFGFKKIDWLIERTMTNDVNGSYTHFPSPMKSYFTSIMLILASAVPGVAIAWFSMRALGLEGVALALATAFFGMVLGVALFAMWIAIGRALKIVK